MNETPLQIAGWLVWLCLAAAAFFGVRRYAKTRKSNLGFWQFTFAQLFVLLTISTVLAWMLYLWCAEAIANFRA